jgi:hypothetical protein
MSRFVALALALVFSSCMALADSNPPDPIGRLAIVSGAVSYQRDATAAAQDAALNTPLTTGNTIEAKPRSHAAIDIGAGRLHLDGGTVLEIGRLDPGNSTLVLKSGAVILHILPGGEGQVFAIATPMGVFRALQPGTYEIEVAAGGETRAAALEGGAQFETIVLRGGMRLTASTAGTAPVLAAAANDDFLDRVAAEMAASGESKLAAPKYVSPEITGFQELAQYGLWVATEQYGWAWEPQVASDWAPFRQGRWVEIAPWGRTWIDDAPWGFAPAHYGSWAEVNRRWVWVPGNAAQPASGVVSAQTQSGGAWVALGPEEPSPASSPVIVNTVRVVNPPAAPKIVNVTTVNNTTNVTTVVKEVRQPSLVIIGGQTPSPPPPTVPPSNPVNRTGLGAAGTPIGGGVAFPGQ